MRERESKEKRKKEEWTIEKGKFKIKKKRLQFWGAG